MLSSIKQTRDANDFNKATDAIIDGVRTVSLDNLEKLKYPQWAPSWDPKDQFRFKNPPPFKHTDRGYFGDPAFENLFAGKNVEHKPLSPKLGTEIKGVQLSTLTDRQKDDLALLVEQRGVVVFREQDFKELPFDDILKWGDYFGPLHVHPTTGAPRGQPQFHIVYRRANREEQINKLSNNYVTDLSWWRYPFC
ncbi:unnamed protein product [Ambrosiozyma monospora]|uniref:Unnamed protein product n=1 Tax=Ambrosiozyma monospora TaxID=43982 RepID=A0ACB5TDB2_AMBMO|nr:unnamed protein product [Ambrosiozyma monospora]